MKVRKRMTYRTPEELGQKIAERGAEAHQILPSLLRQSILEEMVRLRTNASVKRRLSRAEPARKRQS